MHKEEEKDLLEDEEILKPINASPSILLSFVPPIDPFWPSQSFYYILFRLKPKLKSFPQAHHKKSNPVGCTCQFFDHAKLEGTLNQDPYVMLYDIYYGRRPLSDKPPLLNFFLFYLLLLIRWRGAAILSLTICHS